MPTEHFKETEPNVACPCCGLAEVDPALFRRLETTRAVFGPISFTSVCRCSKHNAQVGGKERSAHLTIPFLKSSQAVDIPILFARHRYSLLRAAFLSGFDRIGIGANFVHLDIARDLDREVVWLYPPGSKG